MQMSTGTEREAALALAANHREASGGNNVRSDGSASWARGAIRFWRATSWV